MSQSRAFALPASLAITALIVTACSTPGGAQPAVTTNGQFTMLLDDALELGPPAIGMRAESAAGVHALRNAADMRHDFRVTDGVTQPIKVEKAGD
jgi:hypothetical protein